MASRFAAPLALFMLAVMFQWNHGALFSGS
jgi:hypothetical protein